MKTQIILTYCFVYDLFRRLLMSSNPTIKLIYLPGLNGLRSFNSKARAFSEFIKAKKRVPAYSQFLKERGFDLPSFKGFIPNIHEIPVIDKENYIKKYDINSRCINGAIPFKGVVIDESSGSSGTATNWVRGKRERKVNAKMIQFGLGNLLGNAPLFIINAFALGPWATGVNVTMACSNFATVKSLGPDKLKIENTLLQFGFKHKYVIMGYPPFLKQLVDNPNIPWHNYNVTFIFGGESMSEGMRDYILNKGIKKVYSSLGASDLELNISAENDFTISVRNLMRSNNAFREKISKFAGALPMIFQYNPSDFLMESNDKGELLITICRPGYVAPKIRYNLHDRGHSITMKELYNLLDELNIDRGTIIKPDTDLPLLFHYGRADMTVSFFGCNISPVDIQETIYQIPNLSNMINSFCIETLEDENGTKKLNIAFETVSDKFYSPKDIPIITSDFYNQLAIVNQDFRESRRIAGNEELLSITFLNPGEGIFQENDLRIKSNYIQTKKI